MEVRAEKQNIAPQNKQHSTQGNVTDKYATKDKLDRRKVAPIEKREYLLIWQNFWSTPRANSTLGGYSRSSGSSPVVKEAQNSRFPQWEVVKQISTKSVVS
jgi:hypothetical protein